MTIKTPKLGESVSQTLDGLHIELKRIPVRRYDWDHRGRFEPGHPEYGQPIDRVNYEIWIDGEHVGYASQGYGFGAQQFMIYRLPNPHGEFSYGAGYGTKTYTARNAPHKEWVTTLEQVFPKVAEIRKGDTYHQPGLRPAAVMEAEYQAALIEREREEAARQVERDARAKAQKEKEDRYQAMIDETIEGLKSIQERFGDQHSNFEQSALVAALELIEKKRWN